MHCTVNAATSADGLKDEENDCARKKGGCSSRGHCRVITASITATLQIKAIVAHALRAKGAISSTINQSGLRSAIDTVYSIYFSSSSAKMNIQPFVAVPDRPQICD
jgi:NAD(P)-dependent dehydrogenase (short-subunit alcohol dehydrogenase family)